VKVESSNFAAEHGSGAIAISAVTKAGSATFHGALYDYLRNYRLQANDRSNSVAGVARPESTFNYPGLNVGGPLMFGDPYTRNRDRLFFFAGFEVQEQKVDQGARFSVVPTERQRLGDMSEVAGPGRNYHAQDV